MAPPEPPPRPDVGDLPASTAPAAASDTPPGTLLEVEVVFAATAHQQLLSLRLPPGTTVGEALDLAIRWGLDLGSLPSGAEAPALGIHGEPVAREHRLRQGDRLEIYRPLVTDPRTQRRRRATGRPLA